MKKIFKLIMVSLLVCSLFACGVKKEGGDEPTVGGGSLVIYSPNTDALCAVAEVFGEKYGIDVQFINAKTGECLERIAAEKDNGITTHYCLDGSAALLVNVAEYEKLGLNIDDFDSYEDLLQPELFGKIAMGDPASSSSAWAELTNMLLVKGDEPYDEKAWEWVNTFAKNLNGVIIDGSSAIYKGTYEGEYVVGVSYEDPCVGLLVDQAAAGKETVRLVYPSEGAVWLPAGTAIIKNAPNMENAKLFMD